MEEKMKIDLEKSNVKKIDYIKWNQDFRSRNEVIKMLLDKYFKGKKV